MPEGWGAGEGKELQLQSMESPTSAQEPCRDLSDIWIGVRGGWAGAWDSAQRSTHQSLHIQGLPAREQLLVELGRG